MRAKAFWVVGSFLTVSMIAVLEAVSDNELFGHRLFRDEIGIPMLFIGVIIMWPVVLVVLYELMNPPQRTTQEPNEPQAS